MAGVQRARKAEGSQSGFPHILVTFLKRDIVSGNFLLAVVLVFLALLYSKDIFFPGMSTVGLFIFPISWNNAMGLVALAAGVCSAANYAQERTTNNARYILFRITRRRYLAARFTSICISTGCALWVAFSLFGLFCFIESGGIMLPDDYTQVEVQNMSGLLIEGNYLLWFLSVFTVQFMFGASLGGLGACATAFVPNRFIGYSAPFIVYFMWSQVCSWIGLPIWANPFALSKFTFKVDGIGATLLVYVAAYLGVTLLFFLVFCCKGSKEVRNDS